MDKRVVKAMGPYLDELYGNPGSAHNIGHLAKRAVSAAREQVAALFNCTPEHIIFTSGGTEANNLMIKGSTDYLRGYGKYCFVTSMLEHTSMVESIRYVCRTDPFYIRYVPYFGMNHPEEYMKDDTGMVSLMYINNETGEITDIRYIAEECRRRDILCGFDCVQACGYRSLDTEDIPADYMSISAHKIGGPKGIGALYVRDPEKLQPLIHGGAEQEYGLRGGTENVAAIVGFGKAAQLAETEHDLRTNQVVNADLAFRTELENGLECYGLEQILHYNIARDRRYTSKVRNLRFDGIDGETLIMALDAKGVFISAGSACTAGEAKPSHVLRTMGLGRKEAAESVRVSFNYDTTEEEAAKAGHIMADTVCELKRLAVRS